MRLSLSLGASFQVLLMGATEYTDSSVSKIREHRRAMEKFLDLYESETNVDYMTAIDLDQATMVLHLASETAMGMERARKVYEIGSHSNPFAELKISDGLLAAAKAGTDVMGLSERGVDVKGSVMVDTKIGDEVLLVEYDVDSFKSGHSCIVGGSPSPITTGCFSSDGTVVVAGAGTNHSYSYSYSPTSDNKNGFTLQGLSSQAKELMYDCDEGKGCPHKTYNIFLNYYGEYDYADQWIQASFSGSSTSFKFGNAEFGDFDLEARAASIRWGTVLLNVWMCVVNNLEDAISNCHHIYNDDPIASLDKAVAAYTGWKVKNTKNNGHLLYNRAQVECAKFGTCNKDGMAIVNEKIFENFVEGKQHLLTGKCADAKEHLERITALMVIPLIQGVLRTAYMMDVEDDNQGMTQGQAFAFAASVVPILDACDPTNARLMYQYLRPDGPRVSFLMIKEAFEGSRHCLRISCEDIGGLLTSSGDGYLKGAEPCSFNAQTPADDTQASASTSDTKPVSEPTATQEPKLHDDTQPLSVDTGSQAPTPVKSSSSSMPTSRFGVIIINLLIVTSSFALIFVTGTLVLIFCVSTFVVGESSEPQDLPYMDRDII